MGPGRGRSGPIIRKVGLFASPLCTRRGIEAYLLAASNLDLAPGVARLRRLRQGNRKDTLFERPRDLVLIDRFGQTEGTLEGTEAAKEPKRRLLILS